MLSFTEAFKSSISPKFYNYLFYNYLHLKKGIFPKKLNLNVPTTFNEKIIWLKMNKLYKNAHILADKVLVKEHVKKIIGDKYIIPNIAVYDDPEEIKLYDLPSRFVLKANHGSGWNIVCENKSNFNIMEAKIKFHKWLKINYYDIGKEYQYQKIQPKILCETYLENTKDNPLLDYKIFCFGGKPEIIQVDFDRFTKHTRKYYDKCWRPLPFTILYPLKGSELSKPDALNEMLDIAEKLSKDMSFARIDLYYHKKNIYFGEITFHPEGGFGPFIPQEYDFTIGEYLHLPLSTTK